jgi:hypothetical protein
MPPPNPRPSVREQEAVIREMETSNAIKRNVFLFMS